MIRQQTPPPLWGLGLLPNTCDSVLRSMEDNRATKDGASTATTTMMMATTKDAAAEGDVRDKLLLWYFDDQHAVGGEPLQISAGDESWFSNERCYIVLHLRRRAAAPTTTLGAPRRSSKDVSTSGSLGTAASSSSVSGTTSSSLSKQQPSPKTSPRTDEATTSSSDRLAGVDSSTILKSTTTNNNNTTTTTTTTVNNKSSSSPSPSTTTTKSVLPPSKISLSRLATSASTQVSPRGLAQMFGSLPRNMLSANLFAASTASSTQRLHYSLYVWNGTSASALVRANCLSRCFDVERLLESSPRSVLCRLFYGSWQGAKSDSLHTLINDLNAADEHESNNAVTTSASKASTTNATTSSSSSAALLRSNVLLQHLLDTSIAADDNDQQFFDDDDVAAANFNEDADNKDNDNDDDDDELADGGPKKHVVIERGGGAVTSTSSSRAQRQHFFERAPPRQSGDKKDNDDDDDDNDDDNNNNNNINKINVLSSGSGGKSVTGVLRNSPAAKKASIKRPDSLKLLATDSNSDAGNVKHARIAVGAAVVMQDKNAPKSDGSNGSKKRERPTATTSGSAIRRPPSTTLPSSRPQVPSLALRLPLAKLKKDDDESGEPQEPGTTRPGMVRGSAGSRSFSLKLPSSSGMISALSNDTPTPPPNAALYSKSELLRLYDPICSKILDFLYLGSRCPAMSRDLLKANGITHVLNCAGTICDNYFPDEFRYTTLALVDGGTEDLECLFYYVLELFEEVRAAGDRIFVHCHAGISRSSSFVIAYVMWHNGWDFVRAHEHVKSIRMTVNPNGGFIGQLLQWWSRIHAQPRTRLYRMISHSLDPHFLVPKNVPTISAASLDPRTCFVLHTPERVYAWHGSRALPHYRDACVRVHKRLVRFEGAPSPLVVIAQGAETPEFWTAIGGKGPVNVVAEYNREYNAAALSAPKPASLLQKDLLEDSLTSDLPRAQLFLYPNNILVDTATAADFERISDPDELDSNCMYLLVSDKRDQLFAWVGRNFSPPAGEPKDQFALDAMKAFRKVHQHMFPSPPKLTTVHDRGGNSLFWDQIDLV